MPCCSPALPGEIVLLWDSVSQVLEGPSQGGFSHRDQAHRVLQVEEVTDRLTLCDLSPALSDFLGLACVCVCVYYRNVDKMFYMGCQAPPELAKYVL